MRGHFFRIVALGSLVVGVWSLTARAAVVPTIIYQDNFTGNDGDVMHGRTPDTVTTGGATWTATATPAGPPLTGTASSYLFKINGTLETSNIIGAAAGPDNNAIENNWLPFVPNGAAGYIYDLHLDIESDSAGSSGNWLGLAYTNGNFNGHTPGGASSAMSNNNPFGLIIVKGNGQVQSFAGNGTANGVINSALGAYPGNNYYAIDCILDCSGPQWKMSWKINGVQVGSTFTYTTNPTVIGRVAFGSNKLSGSVDNFSLSYIPEPASLGLLGLAGLALARRRHV